MSILAKDLHIGINLAQACSQSTRAKTPGPEGREQGGVGCRHSTLPDTGSERVPPLPEGPMFSSRVPCAG